MICRKLIDVEDGLTVLVYRFNEFHEVTVLIKLLVLATNVDGGGVIGPKNRGLAIGGRGRRLRDRAVGSMKCLLPPQ